MPNGAKNWCGTLNNYSVEEYERISDLEGSQCGYVIVGKEVGEQGTPHLQFYLQFKTRKTLRTVKRLVGDRVHVEVARGSPEQNIRYCSKEGDFVERGVVSCQGRRRDLDSFVEAAKKGLSWEEALERYPAVLARFGKFADRVIGKYAESRSWSPEVFVYWGETGTGKSQRAFSEASSPYVHSGGGWFDGYSGESDVIFDDFGGSEFKLTYLLKLLDRYPMRVPVKFGFVNWVPRRIFITSNYCPKDWFPNARDEHVKALFRRISKTIVFRRLQNPYFSLENKEEEIVIL